MIKGMQEREREVLLKVRHREAGFHTLLQALQHRMQLLELHLVEAQRAAGLPVSIPPPPPNLGGFLSVGFADSSIGDVTDLAILDGSQADSSLAIELKEELDRVRHLKVFTFIFESVLYYSFGVYKLGNSTTRAAGHVSSSWPGRTCISWWHGLAPIAVTGTHSSIWWRWRRC